MNLSEIKTTLDKVSEVVFVLPNGDKVPSHFHVTEVGQIEKNFIDCGGTLRHESAINFQLFTAIDFDHRLGAQNLKSIIELSERKLGLTDEDIEVEYQAETIGKYALDFDGGQFQLRSKQTDCLAKDNCGIPSQKIKESLASLGSSSENACAPNSGCC
jgi:hypothetical protein